MAPYVATSMSMRERKYAVIRSVMKNAHQKRHVKKSDVSTLAHKACGHVGTLDTQGTRVTILSSNRDELSMMRGAICAENMLWSVNLLESLYTYKHEL